MGFFSRAGSTPKIKFPRWGFRTGWDDFLVALRTAARTYGLTIDDAHIQTGIVPLPHDALYQSWDLRPLGSRCRDLEPYEWMTAIYASLYEMYGRDGEVEVVAGPPQGTKQAPAQVVTDLRERLRVQLFGATYFAMMDRAAIATRPLGDAWLTLVEDLGGGEATITWQMLAERGLDADAKSEPGFVFIARHATSSSHSRWPPDATSLPPP